MADDTGVKVGRRLRETEAPLMLGSPDVFVTPGDMQVHVT